MTFSVKYRAGFILLSAFLFCISLFEASSISYQKDFLHLLFWIGLSFLGYIALLRASGESLTIPIIVVIVAGISLCFHSPNLSVDHFRFLWDGELQTMGISPYEKVPIELIDFKNRNPYHQELFLKMSDLSKQNPTVYTPLNQLVFHWVAIFSDQISTGVILLRILLIAAHLITGFYLFKILTILGTNPRYTWFYLLNPFILIETIGNVHFEGLMIMFLCIGIHLLMKEKFMLGASMWWASISIKLIPLMLLPFLYRKIGFQRSAFFYILVLSGLTIQFWFIFSAEQFENFLLGMRLYFGIFEFNSSLLNLMLVYGEWKYDWNMTRIYAPYLSRIALKIILIASLLGEPENWEEVYKRMTIAFFIYLLLSSTVHPWYLVTILFLGILSGYLFPLIWTITVFFSYSYYDGDIADQYHYWITVEYVAVFSLFLYEMIYGRLLRNFSARYLSLS